MEEESKCRRRGPRNGQTLRCGAVGHCIRIDFSWNCVQPGLKLGRNLGRRILARCKSHFDFGASPFRKQEIIPGGDDVIKVSGNRARDEFYRHDVFERTAEIPAEIIAVKRLCATAVLAIDFHRYFAFTSVFSCGFGQ